MLRSRHLSPRSPTRAGSAGRIEDRHQPDDAGIAVVPFPRKALEGAALAGHLVEIAADILDGRDAGVEQRLVRRVPVREILDRVAAGRLLVFRQQVLDLRAVAMRAERGRERMIDARGVDADQLHLLLHQPFGRLLGKARRMAEIFLAVGIAAMPAGVDEDDVVGLDRGLGLLEIRRLDQLPLLLRDREHDAGAEEPFAARGRRPPCAPGIRWIGALTCVEMWKMVVILCVITPCLA